MKGRRKSWKIKMNKRRKVKLMKMVKEVRENAQLMHATWWWPWDGLRRKHENLESRAMCKGWWQQQKQRLSTKTATSTHTFTCSPRVLSRCMHCWVSFCAVLIFASSRQWCSCRCDRLNRNPKFLHIPHRENGSFEVLSLHFLLFHVNETLACCLTTHEIDVGTFDDYTAREQLTHSWMKARSPDQTWVMPRHPIIEAKKPIDTGQMRWDREQDHSCASDMLRWKWSRNQHLPRASRSSSQRRVCKNAWGQRCSRAPGGHQCCTPPRTSSNICAVCEVSATWWRSTGGRRVEEGSSRRSRICRTQGMWPSLSLFWDGAINGNDIIAEGEPEKLDRLDEVLKQLVVVKALDRVGPRAPEHG